MKKLDLSLLRLAASSLLAVVHARAGVISRAAASAFAKTAFGEVPPLRKCAAGPTCAADRSYEH